MYEVSNIERFAGLQTVNLTYVTAHLFLCMDTKLEDTKSVIRKPTKSKKYGQYNGQRKKMTKKNPNNEPQNTSLTSISFLTN